MFVGIPEFDVVGDGILFESVEVAVRFDELLGIVDVFADELSDTS